MQQTEADSARSPPVAREERAQHILDYFADRSILMSNLIAARHATGAHWRRCYGVGVVHMFASYLGTGVHTTFWLRREQPDVDTFPLSTRVNPRKYFAVCCCCCCCCCCLHIKKPSRSRLYPVPPSVSTSISVCLNINLCHPVTQYPGGTTKIFCGLLDITKSKVWESMYARYEAFLTTYFHIMG